MRLGGSHAIAVCCTATIANRRRVPQSASLSGHVQDDAVLETAPLPPDAFPSRGNWTREQLILALAFYWQTPFGQLHHRNPKIIALAELIGRSPGALAMKLSNLASLDPSITGTGRKGLSGASAIDREVWDAFHADWESLALAAASLHQSLRDSRALPKGEPRATDDVALNDYTGETRQVLTQQRIKQAFFRRAVLAGYRARCCISGVSDTRFLIASHIVAWSEDRANRLNPANGLCLSAIHDKAFDQHLFTLSADYRVVLGRALKRSHDRFLRDVFWPIEDQVIELPDRSAPQPDLLAKHRAATLELD